MFKKNKENIREIYKEKNKEEKQRETKKKKNKEEHFEEIKARRKTYVQIEAHCKVCNCKVKNVDGQNIFKL